MNRLLRFILIWSVLLAACRETAVKPTPALITPTFVAPTLLVSTTEPAPLPATLTREAVQYYIATSLAAHPRLLPTADEPALAANMAASRAGGQTRIASQSAAMRQQALEAQQTPTPDNPTDIILSQKENTAVIDGTLSNGEWSNAAKQTILLNGSTLTLYVQHDEVTLFVAFSGLSQTGQALFPELLLDSHNDKNSQMDDSDWWFQAAARPCWGSGQNAIWQQCGTPENWHASAWNATTDVVEMAIPYETIGLLPGDTQPVGIAFAVLTVTVDGRELRHFWPSTAELDNPQTWGTVQTADGW